MYYNCGVFYFYYVKTTLVCSINLSCKGCSIIIIMSNIPYATIGAPFLPVRDLDKKAKCTSPRVWIPFTWGSCHLLRGNWIALALWINLNRLFCIKAKLKALWNKLNIYYVTITFLAFFSSLKVHWSSLKLFVDYKFQNKVLLKKSYASLTCQPQWLQSFFLKFKTLLKDKLF